MDIDAAVARMRELNAAIYGETDKDELASLAQELSIVTEAIDGWLSKSGAWPKAWLG